MIAEIICFTIANVLTSMLCTSVYKLKHKTANKYAVFSLFFIGYFLFFYLLLK